MSVPPPPDGSGVGFGSRRPHVGRRGPQDCPDRSNQPLVCDTLSRCMDTWQSVTSCGCTRGRSGGLHLLHAHVLVLCCQGLHLVCVCVWVCVGVWVCVCVCARVCVHSHTACEASLSCVNNNLHTARGPANAKRLLRLMCQISTVWDRSCDQGLGTRGIWGTLRASPYG